MTIAPERIEVKEGSQDQIETEKHQQSQNCIGDVCSIVVLFEREDERQSQRNKPT